ncbi:hypothetical protein PAXRUDRAFT_157412 [Paxillus rubicundulus Ve08.2h10]|uniref:Uncharacterized protein n=1 Tax=Paxillus rubicundulus Ve08.2h10 TaxID=930991 RepID=A0A0D0CDZ1_9AGAM|nr:hypothetical protein PAXRUDRAFT_157412 [Paxillus rubicundulus Ve08.2h10]
MPNLGIGQPDHKAGSKIQHHPDPLPDDYPHHSSPPPCVEANFFGPNDKLYRNYHTKLNGKPCNGKGIFVPAGAAPGSVVEKSNDEWTPF